MKPPTLSVTWASFRSSKSSRPTVRITLSTGRRSAVPQVRPIACCCPASRRMGACGSSAGGSAANVSRVSAATAKRASGRLMVAPPGAARPRRPSRGWRTPSRRRRPPRVLARQAGVRFVGRGIAAVLEGEGDGHGDHRAVPVAAGAVVEALEGEIEVGKVAAACEGDVVLLALDGRGTRRQVRMARARERNQTLERPGYPRRPGVDRRAERLLGTAREELGQ